MEEMKGTNQRGVTGAKKLVGTLENKIQWHIHIKMPFKKPIAL